MTKYIPTAGEKKKATTTIRYLLQEHALVDETPEDIKEHIYKVVEYLTDFKEGKIDG